MKKFYTHKEVAAELSKALCKAAFNFINNKKLAQKIVADIKDPDNKAQVLDTGKRSNTASSVMEKAAGTQKVSQQMQSQANKRFSVAQPASDKANRKAYNVRRKLSPAAHTKPQRPQVKSVKRIKGVKQLRTFLDNRKKK